MKRIQVALFIIFVVTFFGGGLLIFVNNLICEFLPESTAEIIGGCVLIEFLLLYAVTKCVGAVRVVRRISDSPSDGDE